jgi:hypothetical protein
MAGRARRASPDAELERVRRQIAATLAEGPAFPGTITWREDVGQFAFYWRRAGRTASVRLPEQAAQAYREAIQRDRRLRELLERYREVSLQALEPLRQAHLRGPWGRPRR